MNIQKSELIIPGPSGILEAILQSPENANHSHIAIICHPHPLQEGTMHNKVVTTVAKAFNLLGYPSVRFNYRGVGQSAGVYGEMVGEVEDCLAVVEWIKTQWPTDKLYFAGFSFGAYIAAKTASLVGADWLISVAPAVERMPYDSITSIACPWLVIQGETDDVVTPQAVYAWYDQLQANKTLVKLPDTGHFFHGKLLELQDIILKSVITLK